MKKILFCFGTRPETIKMAPLINEARSYGFEPLTCITGQHKEMLSPFLDFFNISVEYNLAVMKKDQTLCSITTSILTQLEQVLKLSNPDYVCVQGDTTSTLSCALVAFYSKIPVIHIEAGLRTFDKYSPFPEEANRQMVSTFSSFNFCPTKASAKNLIDEKRENVFVTGNTSIDSLRLTTERIKDQNLDKQFKQKYKNIDFNKRIILVTCHRRENHGAPLLNICNALKNIALRSDIELIYPVHLNPNIKDIVEKNLTNIENIHLLDPLEYVEFSWFMKNSTLILTDSGGVQEEAPYFKKPILILRENTERPEVLTAGIAKLVGSNSDFITKEVTKLLDDKDYYSSFIKEKSPFGDGYSAQKTFEILKDFNG